MVTLILAMGLAAIALAMVLVADPNSAEATFPGKNGKIAFSSNRNGDPSSFEVYSMRPFPEGSANQPVNLSTTAGQDLSPAYSPDGKKIAFHSNRDGDPEIFVMDATGASQDQLTANSSTADFDPSWQPRP